MFLSHNVIVLSALLFLSFYVKEREAQAKAREDNRLKMQSERDREAERLRKEREDALKRGEELKKVVDEESF